MEVQTGSQERTGRQASLPIVEQEGGRIRLRPRREPRFVDEGPLGSGGTGEVVRASDLDIGRRVAIKRLRDDRQHEGDVARFVREIQLVGSLEHPNIVPLHDVGTDDELRLYAVMKYVDGETLTELIERLRQGDGGAHERWDFNARTRLFIEICRGIAFAHARDVLHRDIKPSNVMVGPGGEAQILDWGLAKRRDLPDLPPSEEPAEPPTGAAAPTWVPPSGSSSGGSGGSDFDTRAGAIFGTPPYMSPEQARGEPLDERSEVFALGLLFWELLTLGAPLPGVDDPAEQVAAAKTRNVPHAGTVPAHPNQGPVPSHLGWFVYRATRPEPDQRFASVEDMLDELRAVSNGLFDVRCPASAQRRALSVMAGLVDRYPMILPMAGMVGVGGLVAVGAAIGLALG